MVSLNIHVLPPISRCVPRTPWYWPRHIRCAVLWPSLPFFLNVLNTCKYVTHISDILLVATRMIDLPKYANTVCVQNVKLKLKKKKQKPILGTTGSSACISKNRGA